MVTFNLSRVFMRGADFSVATHFLLCEICERGIIFVENYKDMYYKLFNKITDVIEELKEIQCQTEEKYMEAKTTDDIAIEEMNK